MDKQKELIELGARVREARYKAGLTQAQLAHAVDKDQPSINRLETGKINPSYIYLLEICEGLGISIEELMKSSE